MHYILRLSRGYLMVCQIMHLFYVEWRVHNHLHQLCPLFHARCINGLKVLILIVIVHHGKNGRRLVIIKGLLHVLNNLCRVWRVICALECMNLSNFCCRKRLHWVWCVKLLLHHLPTPIAVLSIWHHGSLSNVGWAASNTRQPPGSMVDTLVKLEKPLLLIRPPAVQQHQHLLPHYLIF